MIEAATTEAHASVVPLTRQVRRSIARKAKTARAEIGPAGTQFFGGTRCRYCPVPVTDPQAAVFANGQVAHAECAQHINTLVDQMNHDRATQRLAEAGFVFERPELLVPAH